MMHQILTLILLIILSGFFSSAETALFSISRTKARHLAKKEGKIFVLIKRMKDDPHRLLSTILIGNNLVNIAAASLATKMSLSYKTISYFPDYAVAIATGVMTLLILVFGEVFPKSLATRNNILIARLVIYPIYWLSKLFKPMIYLLNFIPRLAGKIKGTPKVTEEELITFIESVEEEGEIKGEERDLIHNIFEFDDTSASEIMTPRADMFVIAADEKVDLKKIMATGYTRIPVIENNIDNIVGIVNIKDLFMHQANSNTEVDIRKIMRKPYFVPENKKLDKLLQQFKKRKDHMAVVVDEYGGVSGLITLEDALEEIVGEITDETDKEEPNVVKLKKREWLVLGKSDIDEVNATVGMNIPDSNDYGTFSGYILNRIGKIPEEKEEISIDPFIIIVEEKEGNRIQKYIIRRK